MDNDNKIICECGNDKWIYGYRTTFCMVGAGGHDTYRCSECGKEHQKRYYDSPVEPPIAIKLYEENEIDITLNADTTLNISDIEATQTIMVE
jgi:hypothetical protein